jgi:hypothetical protein
VRLAINATAASTRMAKSSQVLSIERREGVSMAEVAMDDMAIGNPASLMTLAVALGPHSPASI